MTTLTQGFMACLLVFLVFQETNGCKISSWRSMDMTERLMLSDIIVYGHIAQHVANVRLVNGKKVFAIDAVFHVYCVIKQMDDPIPEVITIEEIAPRDGCSNTKKYMQIGGQAIVALKPSLDGKFQYHEVMPMQSASFAASRENFFKISSYCDLQLWQPPANVVENRCPICGTANFTDEVLAATSQEGLTSCLLAALFNNDTDCNIFQTTTFDNSAVCLSANFRDTCTSMAGVVDPNVTCSCEDENKNEPIQVGAATVATQSGVTMVILLALALLFRY